MEASPLDPIRVKAGPLTPEAFAPYGRVLGLPSGDIPTVEEAEFPDMSRVSMCVEKFRAKQFYDFNDLDCLASHFEYDEPMGIMLGALGYVVAEAPTNSETAPPEEWNLDYSTIRAFVLVPGDVLVLKRGTWHMFTAVGDDCVFLNVSGRTTSPNFNMLDLSANGHPRIQVTF